MSIEREDSPDEKPMPCAACNKPSTFGIWGDRRLCVECFSDWQERAPTTGEVEAKYGEGLVPLCAAMERFTAAWLPKRKAELRAHLTVVQPEESP